MNIVTPNFIPRRIYPKDNDPQYIIIHHALAKNCTAEDINRWHIERNFSMIGYHYVVLKNGVIEKCRPNTYHGAHCKENLMNIKSIGICLEGCYEEYGNQTDQEVPQEQMIALVELCFIIQKAWNIPIERIQPHRFWANYKKCPGNYFPWEKFIATLALFNLKGDV